MIKADDEAADSILDLALDSVPGGTCAYVPYRAGDRLRAPDDDGADDPVGWELTRDPVYERCAQRRGRKGS